MDRTNERPDAKGVILTGLGLLTAAAFVAMSFAGDAIGGTTPEASGASPSHAALVPASTPARLD